MNNSDPERVMHTWVEVYPTHKGMWRWSRVTAAGERVPNVIEHPTKRAAILAAVAVTSETEIRTIIAECD